MRLLLAETVTFFVLDGTVAILAMFRVILTARTRIGGAIGRSLWLAISGLLLFGLTHPVQAWFFVQTNYDPALLGIVHRAIVMLPLPSIRARLCEGHFAAPNHHERFSLLFSLFYTYNAQEMLHTHQGYIYLHY